MTRPRERPEGWPDWFEPRRYPHFDQPIRDPEQVRSLVESPEQVAKRAFLPFIRFEKSARKYKKTERKFVKKPRDLKYASHTDSQIFRHYANLLSARYEALIADEGFASSVLAYRRMDPPRCNIHFANEAFEWIESHAPCVAITFDVRDFFEALNHRILKHQWKSLLGVDELPPDHYNVFKAITRYSWVDRDALLARFDITKKMLKTFREPICSPLAFRIGVRCDEPGPGESLVKLREERAGVPQGSPISALLSNIYMLPVDRRMSALASERGGRYLRYSDDIMLICKADDRLELVNALESSMKDMELKLHDGPGKRSTCEVSISPDGNRLCQPHLQYLGFTYDGRTVRIRSQTLARFFRRMRKAARRERHLASRRAAAGGDPRVRKKKLYDGYTHLGRRNFITGYAADARRIMRRNAIAAQLRGHWRELHAELDVDR